VFGGNDGPAEQRISALEMQRRPGPDHPQWKIPHAEWSHVLRRVDQGETYRQIASSYGVSYEAVRRVVREARRAKEQGRE
jgi:DNA invertase Pin-like site-specific DNA recombinase